MDKIKTLINTELSLVPEKFFNVSSAMKQKAVFEEKLGFPISELLSKQKNSDVAKKILGRGGFNACLSIYFNQFDSRDGFDTKKLAQDLEQKAPVYKRHLGSDRMQLLKLLCRVSEISNEKPILKLVESPKGLLSLKA